VSLSEIRNKYEDQIKFVHVYIREVHPVDGWWLGEVPLSRFITRLYSEKVGLDIVDPKTMEERVTVAATCQSETGHGFDTYVDTMDDQVNNAYAALPTRLYLIDTDGTVAYAGGLGPWDFFPARFDAAIEQYLTDKP
jgi:hypothetical protein